MRFERLELTNFASYFNSHSLDLTCTEERPVIVVLGGTGHGKTTLFDAINWALYGIDYEIDLIRRRQRHIADYVNETALRDAETSNKFVNMCCTLWFEHEGAHYYISQELAAKPSRDKDGRLIPIEHDRTTALYEVRYSGSHKRMKYDSIFFDEILPNNVKDYFLFDGDRIYNLSNPGASQEVRDAIYRVVDLELIKNAIDHLSEVAAVHRRDAKKQSTGALSQVDEKYTDAYDRLTKLKQDQTNLQGEDWAARSQLGILEHKLENLPETARFQERRNTLSAQLKQVEEDSQEVVVELRSTAATAALGIAADPISELLRELDSIREKGQIPRNVSRVLLHDLLRVHRCLCGTEFSEGDPIYRALTKRLEEEEQAQSTGNALLELRFQLDNTSEAVQRAIQQLRRLDKRHLALQDDRGELDKALKQVDEELRKLPQEDVEALITQVRSRREDLDTITRKLQQIVDGIEQCQQNIKRLEKQREELAKKQANVHKLQLREHLAQRAADELEKIYETFAESSRLAVEDLTRQEFHKFVTSASAYEVSLNKDYELQVLDSNGNRALQRLSMGQSQCLSLAFITAISRVSEKNPPLVIDMPFGRLDYDVHDEVSRRLPEITSQLILFLIPEVEWNEVTSSALKPKASHIYQLQYDGTNRETTIEEICEYGDKNA